MLWALPRFWPCEQSRALVCCARPLIITTTACLSKQHPKTPTHACKPHKAVLREAATLKALELLELYLELLAMRAPLIASTREIPRDMVEALAR